MYSNEMKWNFKRLILSLYKFLVPKIESTENLIENRVRGWRRKMAQKIQFNHMMACALFYSYRVFHDEHSQFKYGKFVLNIQTTTSTLLMNASHHFISTKQKSQLPTKEKEKKKMEKENRSENACCLYCQAEIIVSTNFLCCCHRIAHRHTTCS